MAFSSTLTKQGVQGDLKYRCYTYATAATNGGVITTDLSTILNATCTHGTDESCTTVTANVANASTVTLGGMSNSAVGMVKVLGR